MHRHLSHWGLSVHSCLANNCPKAVQRESETDILKIYIRTQRADQQESSRQPELQDVCGKYLLICKGKPTVGELTHGRPHPGLLERISITFHF